MTYNLYSHDFDYQINDNNFKKLSSQWKSFPRLQKFHSNPQRISPLGCPRGTSQSNLKLNIMSTPISKIFHLLYLSIAIEIPKYSHTQSNKKCFASESAFSIIFNALPPLTIFCAFLKSVFSFPVCLALVYFNSFLYEHDLI